MNHVSTFRLLLFLLASANCVSAGPAVTFVTPEKAANALLTAIQTGNYPRFLSIAGTRMAEFWNSGDPEKDEILRQGFAGAASRRGFNIEIDSAAPDIRKLSVGEHGQLFPAPLVKTGSRWRFDDQAGAVELARQRVRRNEIAALESCRRFRDAELSIFEGKAAPAGKIRSTPGTRDGLVWSDRNAGDESLLGPAFAAAAIAEHQPHEPPRPLFGYYFKILPDPAACPGSGARGVPENPAPSACVALIAWPARYGIDGFHTFVIDPPGDLYERDLGADTARVAGGITAFVPGRLWSKRDGE